MSTYVLTTDIIKAIMKKFIFLLAVILFLPSTVVHAQSISSADDNYRTVTYDGKQYVVHKYELLDGQGQGIFNLGYDDVKLADGKWIDRSNLTEANRVRVNEATEPASTTGEQASGTNSGSGSTSNSSGSRVSSSASGSSSYSARQQAAQAVSCNWDVPAVQVWAGSQFNNGDGDIHLYKKVDGGWEEVEVKDGFTHAARQRDKTEDGGYKYLINIQARTRLQAGDTYKFNIKANPINDKDADAYWQDSEEFTLQPCKHAASGEPYTTMTFSVDGNGSPVNESTNTSQVYCYTYMQDSLPQQFSGTADQYIAFVNEQDSAGAYSVSAVSGPCAEQGAVDKAVEQAGDVSTPNSDEVSAGLGSGSESSSEGTGNDVTGVGVSIDNGAGQLSDTTTTATTLFGSGFDSSSLVGVDAQEIIQDVNTDAPSGVQKLLKQADENGITLSTLKTAINASRNYDLDNSELRNLVAMGYSEQDILSAGNYLDQLEASMADLPDDQLFAMAEQSKIAKSVLAERLDGYLAVGQGQQDIAATVDKAKELADAAKQLPAGSEERQQLEQAAQEAASSITEADLSELLLSNTETSANLNAVLEELQRGQTSQSISDIINSVPPIQALGQTVWNIFF